MTGLKKCKGYAPYRGTPDCFWLEAGKYCRYPRRKEKHCYLALQFEAEKQKIADDITMRAAARNRERGFMLLEVIIAILLTGLLASGLSYMMFACVVIPKVSAANQEVTNLRTAETKWLVSNNSTPTIDDLKLYVPAISGNYTITSDNVIVGLSYPGMKWNDNGRWVFKRD